MCLPAMAKEVQKPNPIVKSLLGNTMPYKLEYDRQERVKKVAEQAGSIGVSRVLDPNFTNEQSVRTGLQQLGIAVHENTLHGSLQVDGIDAAARIMKATRDRSNALL